MNPPVGGVTAEEVSNVPVFGSKTGWTHAGFEVRFFSTSAAVVVNIIMEILVSVYLSQSQLKTRNILRLV